MKLTPKDWLTIIGSLCISTGGVLMLHVNLTTAYIAGEILAAAGPVLIATARFVKDPPQP